MYSVDQLTYQKSYPPVTDEMLAEIVRRVLAVGEPVKIVLFGSRARGNYKPDSDIDILILEATDELRDIKRDVYLRTLQGVFTEVTVLTYSWRDAQAWKYVPNYILTEALATGKLLYESRVSERQWDVSSSDGAGLVAENIEYKTTNDLVRGWLEKANSDLLNCHRMLESDGPYDTACFHIQQAVEKHLKAFLVFHGHSFEKTHDLDELLRQCNELLPMPELEGLNLKAMSSYAISARYDAYFWPSKETTQEALVMAMKVIETVLSYLPDQAKPA